MTRKNVITVQAGAAGVTGKNRISVEFSDGKRVLNRGNESTSTSEETIFKMVEKEDDSNAVDAGSYKVSPWGTDNLFPQSLRAVFKNNLAPGLLDFKTDMLFGVGYTLVNEGTGQEEEFKAEWEWLNSWDVFNYLLCQVVDFVTCENCFGQVRGTKVGGKVADILHINASECRLEVMKNSVINHVVVGNWEDSGGKYTGYKVWQLFADVAARRMSLPIAMYHVKKPTFGFRYYNYPVYIGAMNTWMPVANMIPQMHLNTLKNMLMAVYHVQIPLQPLLELQKVKKWTQQQLDEYVQQQLDEMDNMLSGSENAGKTWHTFTTNDSSGKPMEWKITLIDNKMKEMSESYLKLFNDSNQALTSAFQVQPSLASIQLGDKMSSGSEVLNSYNLHVEARTPIARTLVTSPINAALKINFPNTTAKLVFKNIPLVRQAKDKTGVGEATIHN